MTLHTFNPKSEWDHWRKEYNNIKIWVSLLVLYNPNSISFLCLLRSLKITDINIMSTQTKSPNQLWWLRRANRFWSDAWILNALFQFPHHMTLKLLAYQIWYQTTGNNSWPWGESSEYLSQGPSDLSVQTPHDCPHASIGTGGEGYVAGRDMTFIMRDEQVFNFQSWGCLKWMSRTLKTIEKYKTLRQSSVISRLNN